MANCTTCESGHHENCSGSMLSPEGPGIAKCDCPCQEKSETVNVTAIKPVRDQTCNEKIVKVLRGDKR